MGYTSKDVVKAQFARLKKQLETNVALTQEQKRKTERAMIGWSFNQYLLSEAPLAAQGMTGYAYGVITDGRKPTEGVGLGTGVLGMYQPSTDQWLRVGDYTVIVI